MSKLIRVLPNGTQEEYNLFDSQSAASSDTNNTLPIMVGGTTQKWLRLSDTDTGRKLRIAKMVNGSLVNKWISPGIDYTITITQSANQTITVHANGQSYTSNVTLPAGTAYTVTIVANSGYNAGKLSTTGGTLNANITITATAATIQTYTITINQKPNETIHVYTGNNYETDHTATFSAPIGTKFKVTTTADSGYNAGKVTLTEE